MKNQMPKVGFAYEQVTVGNTAVPLTSATYHPSGGDQAESAFVTLSGGDVRYRYDGTAPDSSTGHILSDGGYLELVGQNQIGKIQFIRIGARDGILSVTYERV